MSDIGTPCILKTRRLGYDGKGQFRLRSRDDVDAAWDALGAQAATVGLILEGFVAFERELSVVAVRGRDGEFRTWPLTENWHVDGVLSASLAPARVEPSLQAAAFDHARRLADALDYVGVFALELFCRDGELLANEMAPRVHNSGHWTIEGAETSQFQNHLRAVLGLPLGDTRNAGACLHAQLDRRDARGRRRAGASPAATGTTTASRRAPGARWAMPRCGRIRRTNWPPHWCAWAKRCSVRRRSRRWSRGYGAVAEANRVPGNADGHRRLKRERPGRARPSHVQPRSPYFMLAATKSQLTRFQNASTYFGRALR